MAHPGTLSVLTKRMFQFFLVSRNLKVANSLKKEIIYVFWGWKEKNYVKELFIALKMKYIHIMV